MRNLQIWLVLALIAVSLAACAPAETTLDLPTTVPDATTTAEEDLAQSSPTSAPEQPATTQPTLPTPTRVKLEIAPVLPTKADPVKELPPIPPGSMPVPPTDSVSLALIEKAKSDLAQRTGIPTEEISLDYFAYITWPNASLGCPEPGMAYADVLVDGYQILLRAGLDVYSYHGASSGNGPFLCEGIGQKISVPPPRDSLDR